MSGHRTLPNRHEVKTVMAHLRTPKTVSQISAETGMHPSRVVPAIRLLSYKGLVIEVDTDPDLYLGARI